MLTLSDINALTNSHDGDIYSDMFKDAYGCRPRYAAFTSLEDFDATFNRLVERLDAQAEVEKEQQIKNSERFEQYIKDTMELVHGIDRVRAIEIIADAEGELEDMKFYGYERLEWCYGLSFGYIKGTL